MKKFNCDSCGLCCVHCNKIEELLSYDAGGGRCKYLKEDNSCEIYETRPNICRVDWFHQNQYPYMDWDMFCLVTEQACEALKKLDKKKKK